MLMKKLFFGLALLFSTGCCLMSCSQDEIMNAESPVTRDYQTDSEILSKFVDFNSLTGEYYLNENKKSTAISYLTDKDWLDLQQVNPVNYEKYVKGLNELNQQLAEYEKDPNI